MKPTNLITTGLLASIAANAAVITYTFETPGNITGSGVSTAYSAPDANDFGAGITIGAFTLADRDATEYSRFVDRGGSVEAFVGDGGAALLASFTVTIDDTVTVDFSNINFDTSYFTSLNAGGGTDVDWAFETIVGASPASNVSNSGGSYNHDNDPNYQDSSVTTFGSAADADINLTGLTDLTDTSVVFNFYLNASKSHTFNNRSIGLDDINLTGTIAPVPEPSSFALLAGCFGLAFVMLRRR